MKLMGRQPLLEEIDLPISAIDAYSLLRQQPYSFLLDSGMNDNGLGRHSFIGSDPFLIMRSRGREVSLVRAGTGDIREEIFRADPFDVLDSLLKRYALAPTVSPPDESPTPFAGGVVGYLSYDLGSHIEDLPSSAADDLELPESYLCFYDVAVTFDHFTNKAYIASTGLPETEDEPGRTRARERLDSVKELLLGRRRQPFVTIFPPGSHQVPSDLKSNFTRLEYLAAVEAAREYIAAGDIFQVNISQRFSADFPGDAYQLYCYLRHINPAPFAAYLDFDGLALVCASPERFLRVRKDQVETRPMKGTRPRGATQAEDEALAHELRQSVKDKAENVMIVDLVRNDLGRVCSFGSINVKDLWTLEKYATVFQLTSTIEGRLKPGMSRIDLLRACFPGGSITGAPKVRAMEIIDELEPTRRNAYTGSIGYFAFSGEMDLNIVIRTMLAKSGKVYFQVGGAITYDSDPEKEYQETMDKAKALLQSLRLSPRTATVA